MGLQHRPARPAARWAGQRASRKGSPRPAQAAALRCCRCWDQRPATRLALVPPVQMRTYRAGPSLRRRWRCRPLQRRRPQDQPPPRRSRWVALAGPRCRPGWQQPSRARPGHVPPPRRGAAARGMQRHRRRCLCRRSLMRRLLRRRVCRAATPGLIRPAAIPETVQERDQPAHRPGRPQPDRHPQALPGWRRPARHRPASRTQGCSWVRRWQAELRRLSPAGLRRRSSGSAHSLGLRAPWGPCLPH